MIMVPLHCILIRILMQAALEARYAAVAGLYSILFLNLSKILVKSSQDFWRESVLVHSVWGVPAEMVESVSDI